MYVCVPVEHVIVIPVEARVLISDTKGDRIASGEYLLMSFVFATANKKMHLSADLNLGCRFPIVNKKMPSLCFLLDDPKGLQTSMSS